ncbi:MAG: branched-chain amino acid transport system II carrier protein, partial [Oscillospiraceae bacterium]
ACFNTCVGLICCCSRYFCSVFPKISYKGWAVFFAAMSMVISNIGLNAILSLSVPLLNAIYPISIVLILLGLFHKYVESFRFVYQTSILFTAIISIGSAIKIESWGIPFLSQLFYKLPLYSIGLGWIIPAVAGLFCGILLSVASKKNVA